MTTLETKQAGLRLAERLGLKVIGTEGHDLKCACVSCQSSDAGRIHEDSGVYFCYSCQKALNAFDLCKVATGNHKAAIDAMVAVGLFDPPANGNGKPAAAPVVPTAALGPDGDILETVAKLKGCPADSLRAYGAQAEGGAVYIPMVGPDGQHCSAFQLTADGGKGMYAPGKPVGLFLPGRTPKPGETWTIVEGVKDAAALHGLGLLAAGLPGSALQAKFAPLFRDVDCIVIPDGDTAGQQGAEKTAEVLQGVARSVKIAHLPVELKASGGADVRDVLRDQGAEPIRQAIAQAAVVEPPEAPAFTRLLTGAELLAMDLRPRYLVRNVLVEGQPCIIGGRSKTLKTSVACDLTISLGSGTPFLGRFDSQQVAVGFWSGESGAATIRETAKRIAAAKGVNLADCSVVWSFDLPKLCHLDHLDHLRQTIKRYGLQVVIIDPLYLALLSAETAGAASNLFAMGAALQPLSKLAQEAGVTLVVLHHFRKGGQPNEDEPAGLEELTMSGAAEWARQWILLQRRAAYQGDGQHLLWMRCGGSAGHAGLWGVTIDEGQLDPDTFTGRTWEVTVAPVADARAEAKADRDNRKAAEQEQREGEHRARLLEVLRKTPDGDTARALRGAARLNTDSFDRAIFALMQEGRALSCEVTKTGRKYDGFKPSGK